MRINKLALIAAGESSASKLAIIRGMLSSFCERIHESGYSFAELDDAPRSFCEGDPNAGKTYSKLVRDLLAITYAEEVVERNEVHLDRPPQPFSRTRCS
jgi:hypothetical protein